jgi:hypothetical protein
MITNSVKKGKQLFYQGYHFSKKIPVFKPGSISIKNIFKS